MHTHILWVKKERIVKKKLDFYYAWLLLHLKFQLSPLFCCSSLFSPKKYILVVAVAVSVIMEQEGKNSV